VGPVPINEGTQHHTKCRDTTDAPFPARVLSLKKRPDGSKKVFLKETGGVRGVFACLSHRWGGSEGCVTTRAKYADMLNDMAWDSIPRTFQDAIDFSLALGISYIWIDSYCVIQDDPGDWREQAALMADIYQNSYITLSTTTASNNESGCFWGSDRFYAKKYSRCRACNSRSAMKGTIGGGRGAPVLRSRCSHEPGYFRSAYCRPGSCISRIWNSCGNTARSGPASAADTTPRPIQRRLPGRAKGRGRRLSSSTHRCTSRVRRTACPHFLGLTRGMPNPSATPCNPNTLLGCGGGLFIKTCSGESILPLSRRVFRPARCVVASMAHTSQNGIGDASTRIRRPVRPRAFPRGDSADTGPGTRKHLLTVICRAPVPDSTTGQLSRG
jgi:hypothetical protein